MLRVLTAAMLFALATPALAEDEEPPPPGNPGWQIHFYRDGEEPGYNPTWFYFEHADDGDGIVRFDELRYWSVNTGTDFFTSEDGQPFTEARWLAFNLVTRTLLPGQACGTGGCDDNVLFSARTAGDGRGFLFGSAPNVIRTYPGGEAIGFDRYQASESAPGGPLPIPEPGIWALLIAGFGLTGAVMRRRATAVTGLRTA